MAISKDVVSEINFGPGECFGTYTSTNPICAKECIVRLPCKREYENRLKEEAKTNDDGSEDKENFTFQFLNRLETELLSTGEKFEDGQSSYSYRYGDFIVLIVRIANKTQRINFSSIWSSRKEKIAPFKTVGEAIEKADWIIKQIKQWIDKNWNHENV